MIHDSRVTYELINITGGVVTTLTTSENLDALARSRDEMNQRAAPGVRYAVRLVLVNTRPLTVLDDEVDDTGGEGEKPTG